MARHKRDFEEAGPQAQEERLTPEQIRPDPGPHNELDVVSALEPRLVDYCYPMTPPTHAPAFPCRSEWRSIGLCQHSSRSLSRRLPGPFEPDSVLRHAQETDAHLSCFAMKPQFEPLSQ